MRARWSGGLRARVVATTAVVTLLGTLVLVAVVWLVLDSAVAANARSALADRTDTVLTSLTVDGSQVSVDESAARDATVWVFARDGSALYGPSGGDLDQEAAELSAGSTPAPVEWHDWLLQARAVPGADRDVLVIGLPIGGYESTKHLAALVSGLVGVVVVVATTVLTAWSTRRSLAPVGGMARSAAEWSATDLERRFSLGEPRDEITELGGVLDGLLDRAAHAIRSERRLSAELAHEIRSPLTVIRGEAELAAFDAVPGSPQMARLDAIIAASDSLTQVVETLLAINRGERMPEAVTPLDDAVAVAVELAGGRPGVVVRLRGIRDVEVAVPQVVASQALAPLIANAVRYARSRVDISAQVADGTVRLVVEDDGPGVTAPDPEMIFEAGWRDDESPGAGLGLPLARRVARIAGGDVRLETTHPARLVVTLPSSSGVDH